MNNLKSLIAKSRTDLLAQDTPDPCDRSLLDYYRQRMIDEGVKMMRARRANDVELAEVVPF